MDNLAFNSLEQIRSQNKFSGWTGINIPDELEKENGIWVTKAGARNFPGGFYYNPENGSHWEWGAILDGGFELEYTGGIVRVNKGTSYIMASDIALSARPINNPFLVWVEISGPVAIHAVRKLGGKRGELVISKFSNEQIKSILKIANLLHDHPYGYNLLVHSLLWTFLADSVSSWDTQTRQISPNIRKTIDFVNNQESFTKYTLDQLSVISGLSIETFRKKFYSEIGESPIKYMLKCQIKKAKELLSDKGINIKQVAHKSGFDDQYYFSRLFKKYEGLSPAEFRKRFYP